MKKVMFDQVGIYRNEKDMKSALEKIHELQERYKHVSMTDTGKIFNTELLNAWELGNMLDVAEVVTDVRIEQDRIARRTFTRRFPEAR